MWQVAINDARVTKQPRTFLQVGAISPNHLCCFRDMVVCATNIRAPITIGLVIQSQRGRRRLTPSVLLGGRPEQPPFQTFTGGIRFATTVLWHGVLIDNLPLRLPYEQLAPFGYHENEFVGILAFSQRCARLTVAFRISKARLITIGTQPGYATALEYGSPRRPILRRPIIPPSIVVAKPTPEPEPEPEPVTLDSLKNLLGDPCAPALFDSEAGIRFSEN